MALNSDFKVKDSLYVGNSACFVTMTDTPKILSAGTDLFDIFLQDGEIATSCTLSNGTGIDSFSFDTSADITINVNDAVIDGVAEGNAQGKIAVTNLGNTTSQIDVNGMQTTDSPTFGGLALNGALTTSSTVDGRDVSTDGTKLDGIEASADVTDTINVTSAGALMDSEVTNLAQVKAFDSSDYATSAQGATADAALPKTGGAMTGAITTNSTFDGVDIAVRDAQLSVLQNLSAANLIEAVCTAQGEFTSENAAGTQVAVEVGLTTGDAPSFAGLDLTSVSAGTDNSVLVLDGTSVATDEIDSRVWGSTLVDGSGTPNSLPLWSDANTIADSIILQAGTNITVNGSLSAISLSGDGSGLTGVTATAIFPPDAKTGLVSNDKFFIEDSATSGSKYVTYCRLLTDAAGTNMGLEVNSSQSLALKNYSNLSDGKISKWDDTNGQYTDSIITETAGDIINIAGGLTVTENLSVLGTFTCIDTSVSVTSALSVINTGTGPAFYAEQTGVSQPIAKFIDTEGGQMVIGDTGNVGIGGSVDNPSEKLVVTGNANVSGNLTINGNTTLGNASGDSLDINAATINAPNIPDGSQNGNKVLSVNGASEVVLDGVDSKIFNTKLVDTTTDATTQNNVPKFSNASGTVGPSNITDTGSLVSIDSNVLIDAGHKLTTKASSSVYTVDASYTGTVASTATTTTTFLKADLKSVEYQVTLVKGVNVTSFKINAVYNGTDTSGTTYAIVDAQTASQLSEVTISNSSSTIDLNITAASDGTTAVIQGTALYSS